MNIEVIQRVGIFFMEENIMNVAGVMFTSNSLIEALFLFTEIGDSV